MRGWAYAITDSGIYGESDGFLLMVPVFVNRIGTDISIGRPLGSARRGLNTDVSDNKGSGAVGCAFVKVLSVLQRWRRWRHAEEVAMFGAGAGALFPLRRRPVTVFATRNHDTATTHRRGNLFLRPTSCCLVHQANVSVQVEAGSNRRQSQLWFAQALMLCFI